MLRAPPNHRDEYTYSDLQRLRVPIRYGPQDCRDFLPPCLQGHGLLQCFEHYGIFESDGNDYAVPIIHDHTSAHLCQFHMSRKHIEHTRGCLRWYLRRDGLLSKDRQDSDDNTMCDNYSDNYARTDLHHNTSAFLYELCLPLWDFSCR